MPAPIQRRVLTISPMPPEKAAYALARYSRSPDSISQSIDWVRTHDSRKFLESFYFQYGHASIADLGHVTMCFEGISELAATEIEDEQLWDGQAKSSRYQDFSKSGFITPPELEGNQAYQSAGAQLLRTYEEIHKRVFEHLAGQLPRPEAMKPDAYQRNLAARAFDVARYLLFFGIPTNVGQVTSIRTLEKQIRRLKSSEYAELRLLGAEMGEACTAEPGCVWEGASEPVAPTLAKYTDPDAQLAVTQNALTLWAAQNLPPACMTPDAVDLMKPTEVAADIVATVLYPVTDRPFRELYEWAASASGAVRKEVIDLALGGRARRDDLPRSFRGGLYAFDIVMDIGAYRDLHRHRRCHQFRQAYTAHLGYETPKAIIAAGLTDLYEGAMNQAIEAVRTLPQPASQYLLPFGARSRFLFKMDFAEAEYIARVRSGVKGHFSYREVAWKMKEAMDRLEPDLGRLIEATPPWIEDPLTR
jgi:thymidylate synthase ThyX